MFCSCGLNFLLCSAKSFFKSSNFTAFSFFPTCGLVVTFTGEVLFDLITLGAGQNRASTRNLFIFGGGAFVCTPLVVESSGSFSSGAGTRNALEAIPPIRLNTGCCFVTIGLSLGRERFPSAAISGSNMADARTGGVSGIDDHPPIVGRLVLEGSADRSIELLLRGSANVTCHRIEGLFIIDPPSEVIIICGLSIEPPPLCNTLMGFDRKPVNLFNGVLGECASVDSGEAACCCSVLRCCSLLRCCSIVRRCSMVRITEWGVDL